ncbi:MAG: hypothetical protein LBS49_07020 [Candidatus Accumulibacter sp.]|jgi:uncharacterized protein YgbK (DUF1537 family)|nr:hypothetical protein [Accumulibacter sp.]
MHSISGGEQPLRIAILADDMTGAGDTAVQFAERRWPSYLQRADELPPLPAVSALARSLNTRALPGRAAASLTEAATKAMLEAGTSRLYLKVDSTMRGSVAAQLEGALRAWRELHPRSFVVLCPAYPAMGRTIDRGRLWVNGVALEDSPAGTDPVTPMRSSLFSELVPGSAVVPEGTAAWLLQAVRAAARKHDIVVVEASSEATLDALSEVIAQLGPEALPAGSAGLALALAKAWRPRGGSAAENPGIKVDGTILILRTSANEVSRRQVCRVIEAWPGGDLPRLAPEASDLSSEKSARDWAGRLRIAAPGPRILILEVPAERIDGEPLVAASQRIARGMASAVEAIAARAGVEALVLIGGDGVDATLAALGVKYLRVMRRVVEGVPVCEAFGASGQRMIVVTKAGGFGDEDTLLAVLDWLQGH